MRTLSALQKSGLSAGLVGLGGCVFGALVHASSFYPSYLQAFGFWIMISLGCLGLLMLHDLTGGRWGKDIKPMLEAGARTLPLMALFVLPIALLGFTHLYSWGRPADITPLVAQKAAWLNRPFFLGRIIFYFAFWLFYMWMLVGRKKPGTRNGLTGIGTLLNVLVMSFFAFDLYMSLEPEWFSSIYGGLFLVGSLVSTFSFIVVMSVCYREGTSPDVLHDLGKFMLMSVMLWAYFNFSQYLIIWSAKIPEEMTWYSHRMKGGWQWLGLCQVVVNFAVPFVILLQRDLKRRGATLMKVALFLLFTRVLDLWWWVGPAMTPGKMVLPYWLPVAFAGIGGIWMWRFGAALSTPTRGGAHG